MKKIARFIIISILGWQVRRLRKRCNFKIIGIAGSIGKTSTKFVLASALKQKFKIRFQEGNYNDAVSIPLVFFGRAMPSLFNPFSWFKVFFSNEITLRKPYEYDYVLVELGTDGPGQIAEFKRYLQLDMVILTAIAPEHMENFSSLDDVAEEELSVAGFSGPVIVNIDLCKPEYLSKITDKITYGTASKADYRIEQKKTGFRIYKTGQPIFDSDYEVFSRAQLFSICAAFAAGSESGLSPQQIEKGIRSTPAVNGRMQLLRGIEGSTIIDDTYNSSPEAVKEALDTLYETGSKKKLAVLGSMNELGDFSEEAHKQIGGYCDPSQLNMLITVGGEANNYLAAAAEGRGCKVERFKNPYDAGDYLKNIIDSDTTILAKGSQNGVFVEETVKQILADPSDSVKLVRQSDDWLAKKRKQFKGAKT